MIVFAAFLFLTVPALAGGPAAGQLGRAELVSAPEPVRAPAEAGPELPPAGWVQAVKAAYLRYEGLSAASLQELPEAARRQMAEDAALYPSKALKLTIDGRTAYLIENDNNDALFVNVFDAAGNHIAFGGFDENYDFYWLKGRAAAGQDARVRAAAAEARGVTELELPEYCRINDKDLNALAEAVMTRESPRDPRTGNLVIELKAASHAGKEIKASVMNVRHGHPGDQFHIEVFVGGGLLFKSGRQDNPIFIAFESDGRMYSLTCFEDIR